MNRITGKTRYRSGFNKVLILQVEENLGEGPPDFDGMPKWMPGVIWRDAKVEDLLELGRINGTVLS